MTWRNLVAVVTSLLCGYSFFMWFPADDSYPIALGAMGVALVANPMAHALLALFALAPRRHRDH